MASAFSSFRGAGRVDCPQSAAATHSRRGEDTAPYRRAALAVERSVEARRALLNCQLCAHHCGVNRIAGEQGFCHAGPTARVFSAQVEVSDELELIPTFAIALSGCDLRCAFCITGAQSWNARAGEEVDLEKLAAQAAAALARGAHSIMILGGEPTIHLATALQIVSVLPEEARLVWKTNAHGSAQARELLAGLFDVWLADYKFGNDDCAQRLARVPNYNAVVRENLSWAARDSELIVRHLLMPEHVECCWSPVAAWLANEMPGVKVNLREGFWPGWQASRHAELRRTVSTAEAENAWSIAREFELNLVE
jgi:putative pyruvate formate lyase activating enzyme